MTTGLASLVEAMRKMDKKARIKLVLLIALKFYDCPPLTQAEVFSAVGAIATVAPSYGAIFGMKYAHMKGLDWKTWKASLGLGNIGKKRDTSIRLSDPSRNTKSAQAVLPYAKAVVAGRLVVKGLSIYAPFEARLDKLLQHHNLF